MSPFHIPTGSTAVLLGGLTCYLDSSDILLNNYTTESFQTLSHSPFIARTSFRAITTFSDSVAKQRPQSEHDAHTQHQNVWTHTTPTAFTKMAEMYKMKDCGISVGDTQQITKSLKNKFLLNCISLCCFTVTYFRIEQKTVGS